LIALPESFYMRDTVTVARALLGKTLVHGERAGRIVEVEAYLGAEDLAAHASRGLTPRTRVVFGPPGRAYVYLNYGIHECLNVVAEPEGVPGCVLIRALSPLSGLSGRLDGPGRLTKAMGIDRRFYGHPFWPAPLRILDAPPPAEPVAVTPRIGITQCADWPLRFLLDKLRG
jgi:DNA-3-methyladenine glycosylase